ncbi:MAG: DUF4445 domain-containing protein [Phycisphaerales bacterium]|jgi:uncharacterized 2Fe-2S/4Fe-4S cluster protein (DUF4445 family)|nr:DUF4445 domain-containing protein [Phycisphaerales bacterium]
MSKQLRVTFEPHGRAVFVLEGTRLLEAAGCAGMTIETPCGGAGTCGKCRVRLTAGAGGPTGQDVEFFSAEELADGWRLACQTAICADTVVSIPASSRFADRHQILAEAQAQTADDVLPAIRKQYVQLTPASLEDDAPDLIRLQEAIGHVQADLETMQTLSRSLRECNWCGTAVLSDHRLMDFEPGDTTGQCYGAAFDIGTTTLVGSLLDLNTGDEIAIASAINPQTSFGDDVLSRILYSQSSPSSAAELRKTIIQAVDDLISQLCTQASIDRQQIYELALTGNTTMQHLLCGMDVKQLGEVPFTPTHGRGLIIPASDLGLSVHRQADAYVFPLIGGFVGGDTVSCIIAAKLSQASGPTLMVDIGTNGEIVLAHDGELWAASTAAGPAFEGARISCGMRATHGAIEKVVIGDDVEINVIGNAGASGLCGSGLIDLAAELLNAGIISPMGNLLTGDDLPADLPIALKKRIKIGADDQPEFLIARGSQGQRITLTQRDIRELQLGTGAIRAGVNILLKRAGLAASDLDAVLIAGGFGSFIRRSKAQRIGLLPEDIPHNRIKYIGNAALNGARWALLSTRIRAEAESAARQAKHIELSQDFEFQSEFAQAMIFPDGE